MLFEPIVKMHNNVLQIRRNKEDPEQSSVGTPGELIFAHTRHLFAHPSAICTIITVFNTCTWQT